ncbi:MAG: DUF4349 domain-containing protein, partial [Fimbriiglobus sp.]
MPGRAWVLAALAVSLAGCGNQNSSKTFSAAANAMPGPPAAAPPRQGGPVADAAPAGGGKPAQPEPTIQRKIIFSGVLEVVVKDFDAARKELTQLVTDNGGYFSRTDVHGDVGAKRTGTFVMKVPAEKFQDTADKITRLGIAVKNASDSQDVTEEFVDVSARVRNLKIEEEVLNKLLRDAAGRLEDVFKIRQQILTIRGDIERAEGRLTVLTALTSLSTL